MDTYYDFEKLVKQINEKKEKVRSIIFNWMVQEDIKSYKYSDAEKEMNFTNVRAGESVKFDSTKFKKEQPEMYMQFLKESQVKSYLKMTLKTKVANAKYSAN